MRWSRSIPRSCCGLYLWCEREGLAPFRVGPASRPIMDGALLGWALAATERGMTVYRKGMTVNRKGTFARLRRAAAFPKCGMQRYRSWMALYLIGSSPRPKRDGALPNRDLRATEKAGAVPNTARGATEKGPRVTKYGPRHDRKGTPRYRTLGRRTFCGWGVRVVHATRRRLTLACYLSASHW